MTSHGVGMDIFWNFTFLPLIGHPTHLCAIHKILHQIKQIIRFLLVMQIAITLILFLKMSWIVLYMESVSSRWWQFYVIFLFDNDVSRKIKKSLLKFSMVQDHIHVSLPSNELHLYPLHSLWLMDPFFHHTNQTLLLWSENIHTVNELVVESLKFEAEQPMYKRQSIFIRGEWVMMQYSRFGDLMSKTYQWWFSMGKYKSRLDTQYYWELSIELSLESWCIWSATLFSMPNWCKIQQTKTFVIDLCLMH